MTLYSGIDTVSFISNGVYSETYGSADGGNIAALFVSYGMLESAPTPVIPIPTIGFSWFRRGWFSRLRKE